MGGTAYVGPCSLERPALCALLCAAQYALPKQTNRATPGMDLLVNGEEDLMAASSCTRCSWCAPISSWYGDEGLLSEL